jgi:serine-type D-Ala-D-Ala carboxypeptidase/endopeptidase (penicillin-binding protein 4)
MQIESLTLTLYVSGEMKRRSEAAQEADQEAAHIRINAGISHGIMRLGQPLSPPRMLAIIRFYAWIFLAGCAVASSAQVQAQGQESLPQPMADALKRAALPTAAVGLIVLEADSGKLVAGFNSNTALNPASTMKLVTTHAALDLLGPTYSWKTQAYTTGSVSGDVLQGDLVIRGGGDPKLVIENLWLFVRQIRARGIREIRGNLQLDRSAFEEAPPDSVAFDGDPLRPYNAKPDALLFNFKSQLLRFVPDTGAGVARLQVEPVGTLPPAAAPRLSNGDCGDWQSKLGVAVDAQTVRFNGAYPSACGEKSWLIHAQHLNHAQYFDAVFRQLWSESGGRILGSLALGPVPPGAQLLAEWRSPALSEVIRDINKFSNNVMARQLLLTLAMEENPTAPATAAAGAAVLKRWLASKGIDAPELVVENGSGLSRRERISAETLGRMLVAAFRSPLMPEFVASLPLVGQDGSMRLRLRGQGVAGRAHIKTGSLAGVRAIAGYLDAANGKRYALVSIVNHPNAAAAQEAHDALLQWLYALP